MDRRIRKLIKDQEKDRRTYKVYSHLINPTKWVSYDLTPDERAVLALKMAGFSYLEISQLLHITIHITKYRCSNGRKKVGLPSDYILEKLTP